MGVRFAVVLLAGGLLGLAGCTTLAPVADADPAPDLKPLHAEVKKLVEKHYPKAKVVSEKQTVYFEFNTRKFMIHEPLLTGEWQDAFETVGPQKGGVAGNLTLIPGEYGGQAVLPQSFDKRYFTHLVMAPHSKKRDYHMHVSLQYPRDASKEFLKDFVALAEGFEKHVGAGK
jgi:hypothetical protein